MATILVFLISSLAIAFFVYRLTVLIRKNYNLYAVYFLGAIALYGIGEIIGLLLLLIHYFTKQNILLFWLDVVSRLSLYLGSAFIIQIPLYLYYPKSRKRYYASLLMIILGLALFFYNLTLRYQPFIDSAGIIHWESPLSISVSMAIIISAAWIPTSIVFLIGFVKSKFRSFKSFSLGLGFLLICLGSVLQDFTKSNLGYSLLYLSVVGGAILILIGFIIRQEPEEEN